MDEKARFRRVEELFHRLVDLPELERGAILEPLRSSEPEIHAHLSSLLRRADTGALSALSTSLPAAAGGGAELLGSLGPYRLLRKLGEGGMGVVYEAEQHEPLVRRVAIKLIRFGGDSERILARFHGEQQALALMRHPNVAQVHDAGTSPDGRPFFVMELVEGLPLQRHCDERGLDVTQRLALFLEVCAGVEHAHQKGVIHRDLKPSNILVSEAEGVPRPKIIDFGIAKALGEAAAGGAGITNLDEAIGTLEYMSPEQTRGASGVVDTRSDVYALGVVLYELLTGELPIPVDTLRDVSLAAAYAAIQEQEPPPPSRRASTASGTRANALTGPRGDSAALSRRLRGDLDWIALRALAKDPDRRYPGVAQLADDVARYLRDEPVSAGPPSAGYRLRKFARRHRAGMIAASVVLLALVAGIAGTTAGLLRARRAEAEARSSEAAARVEAATASAVSDFLVDLFRVSDPRESRGRAVTALEILERGAERIEQELADEPEVKSRLLETIGRVHVNLGLYDEARPHLEAALALHERTLSPTDPRLAHSYVELGRLLRLDDDPAGAEAAYRRALEILERGDPVDARELGRTLNELGLLLGARDPQGARAAYQRSRELTVAEYGPDHELVWRLDANIAALEARQGEFERAHTAFEAALAGAEATLGPDHPDLGPLLGNLAFVLRKLGRHREALALQERDLALSERTLGPRHPAVGVALVNLVAVRQRLGDYERAARDGERAIAVLREALGEDHRHVALARNNHARTLLRTGDLAGARRLLEQAIAAAAGRGEDDALVQDLLRSQLMLSTVERHANDVEEAKRLATAVLGHPRLSHFPALEVDARFALAQALAREGGSSAAALTALDEARRAAAAAEVAESEPLFAEARFWALAGEVERAIELLERAVEADYGDALVFTDPELEPLRRHPDFTAIAERLREHL